MPKIIVVLCAATLLVWPVSAGAMHSPIPVPTPTESPIPTPDGKYHEVFAFVEDEGLSSITQDTKIIRPDSAIVKRISALVCLMAQRAWGTNAVKCAK